MKRPPDNDPGPVRGELFTERPQGGWSNPARSGVFRCAQHRNRVTASVNAQTFHVAPSGAGVDSEVGFYKHSIPTGLDAATDHRSHIQDILARFSLAITVLVLLLPLWNTATGQMLCRLTNHTKLITAAVSLPGGSNAMTASLDGTIRVWDTATGAEKLCLQAGAQVGDAALSLDGHVIASCDTANPGTAALWDAQTGALLRVFTDTSSQANGLGGLLTITALPAHEGTFTNTLDYSGGSGLAIFTAPSEITVTGSTRLSLDIRFLGAAIELAWPTNSAGFQLQRASALVPSPSWDTVTNAPASIGDEFRLQFTTGSAAQFYRLTKP